MTFYHRNKDAALEAGQVFAEYWHVRAEFEPQNGWVIVLKPKSLETLRWAWADILDFAEIDLTGIDRYRIRPRERVPITPSQVAAPPPPPPSMR